MTVRGSACTWAWGSWYFTKSLPCHPLHCLHGAPCLQIRRAPAADRCGAVLRQRLAGSHQEGADKGHSKCKSLAPLGSPKQGRQQIGSV